MKFLFYKNTNTNSDDKDLLRFVTKKWIKVYDQSRKYYNVNKEIRLKTPSLRSDASDFSDAYTDMEENITLNRRANVNKSNKSLAFKNNAPSINCISKINGVLINNAEDLNVVIPMYSLIEYSKIYRKTTGSFGNYYRDELNNSPSPNSGSFKYKTKH